jgi:transcriptional regulator with XRE-family HTH domain
MSAEDKKHPGPRADPDTRARAIAALGILIARHKTKSALAVVLGVDRSSVRQWFNGRAFPSAKMACVILNEATIDQHKKQKRKTAHGI